MIKRCATLIWFLLLLILICFLSSCRPAPIPVTPAVLTPVPRTTINPTRRLPTSAQNIPPTLEHPTDARRPTKTPTRTVAEDIEPPFEPKKPARPTKTSTLTPMPELSPTTTNEHIIRTQQVITPVEPLDPKSYTSILSWIKYSLSKQDISVINHLSSETINFGLDEADDADPFPREALIRILEDHLSQETQCLAYTYSEGEITRLEVFISNWVPQWNIEGRESDDLILFFSDEYTKGKGLYLLSVWLPVWYKEDFIDELYKARC